MPGQWMRLVLGIQDRWSIRPLIWQRAIVSSISGLFTGLTIQVSSSPLFTLSPSVGIKASTTRPSTLTPIMPSSGYRSASARPSWSAPPRQSNSTRLSPEQRTGLTHTISAIPSSYIGSGHVKIWYDDYYAQGPKVSVFPDSKTNKPNLVYFIGRSKIVQREKDIIADKIRMTMNPKDFTAEGNVKTIIHNVDTKDGDL